MKTVKLLMATLMLFAVFAAVAQTDTKGFRFQGFADTPEGEALKKEAVTIRFTIYPKTGSAFVFVETQEQKTDNYGNFYANVGEMNPDDLKKLNFTAKNVDYWMKVEVKRTVAGVYSIISDTNLAATPYARHAANGVPVGTIMSFAGKPDKIPSGWLLCDGSEYDGEDPLYEQLYETVGNNWGGSGTAFNVPELTGNFMRGQDKEAGNDGDAANRVAIKTGGNTGDKIGSFQADGVGTHGHTLSSSANTAGSHSHSMSRLLSFSGGSSDGNGGDGEGRPVSSTYSGGAHTHSYSGTTNNNTGATETRPRNVYVAYIIKY